MEALVQGAHIFHFSGHGKFKVKWGGYGSKEGKGYLLMGDRPLSAEKLALKLAQRGVRLAMLAACESGDLDQFNAWTGIAPALTRAGIPAVVGMQFTVRDKNAIAFSNSFYRALAAHRSIDEAVTDGRQAIFTLGDDDDERDWGVPVLYLRAEEGILFPKSADSHLKSVGDTQLPAIADASRRPKRNSKATCSSINILFRRSLSRSMCSATIKLSMMAYTNYNSAVIPSSSRKSKFSQMTNQMTNTCRATSNFFCLNFSASLAICRMPSGGKGG